MSVFGNLLYALFSAATAGGTVEVRAAFPWIFG
jgi:hypothetical protein